MRELAAALPGAGDTIVALATSPGRSALALIRMSGPDALRVASRVVRPWPPGRDREAHLAAIHDPNDSRPRTAAASTASRGDGEAPASRLLDRALVTVFRSPRSYTGEDLVEIATHGGLLVPASVLAALVAAGAREALPGEFTRRAVLNGKLDLVQAEALGDLIDARSRAMQRAALGQLDGGVSRRIAALREGVLEVEALLAYDIDFPEEDDGPVPARRILEACQRVEDAISVLLATATAGELLRDGALVVIAGPPNAGKSSLFNALLGRARAIVTPVPGTTRDAIEAVVEIDPASAGGREAWPLRLVDTAGLRETTDVVERLGIEVSERYLAAAHLVLACGEHDDHVAAARRAVARHTSAPVLGVRTKSDLDARPRAGRDAGTSASGPVAAAGLHERPLRVSAETGAGLAALVSAILDALATSHGAVPTDAPVLTRTRHRRALAEACEELRGFRLAWSEARLPAPVAAVHLRAAAVALETVIGAVGVEDVLERVFSTFCVGK